MSVFNVARNTKEASKSMRIGTLPVIPVTLAFWATLCFENLFGLWSGTWGTIGAAVASLAFSLLVYATPVWAVASILEAGEDEKNLEDL